MRWWYVGIIVASLVAIAIFGVPPSWAPFVRSGHWVMRPMDILIGVWGLPGYGLLHLIWPPLNKIPQQENVWTAALGVVLMIYYVVFGWIFWSTLLSRSFKLIGLWNPFGWRITMGRPYLFRAIGRISDWWEGETKFGRVTTGGFSSLLGVLSNEFVAGDIFLGRPKLIIGGMLRPIGIPTEKHMVTIAGTGAGKSTGALIPNLCIHEGSLLCIDPKGELARITARRRGDGGGGVRGMGQRVYVLDPFKIVPGFHTASYNVFDELERVAQSDAERPVSYAGKIAQALVPSSSRDPYWDDAPRTFITGLILYLLQGPRENRNLVHLRQLIMEGDAEAYGRIMKAGGDSRGDAFDALLAMMKQCPEGPYRHVIAGSANALSMMSPNQRSSVMSMAMEHTKFLDLPEIRHVSEKSDFLLEDLKLDRISVYLCLPLNSVTGSEGRWLRMFVMMTVDMMTRTAKAPKPPILLAIDEFPSLGKLDGIEAVAPTMRSYGVRLWVIGQDIEQFEKVYPESWGGFFGNAEAVQFMGVTHPPTVAWLAERLGEHEITEFQQTGSDPRELRPVKKDRALRDQDQIARMLSKKKKNQIVWRGSERPMLLKICPYFDYMPWWYYSRDRGFRQKLRQWIWRWGWESDVFPPSMPPFLTAPPPAPPPRPPENIMPKPPDKRDPPFVPPLPMPTGIVPGTNLTWEEVLKTRHPADNPAPAAPRDEGAPGGDLTWEEVVKRRRTAPDNAPEPPKTAKKTERSGLEELDAMTGLDGVKTQVRKTLKVLRLERVRERKGMPPREMTNHLVFTGNPGTGKTTVARIIGKIYREIGLLKKGHMVECGRVDLIGGYLGQTALKTQEVIDKALDGVLFIDEAYSLIPEKTTGADYGQEAIATLVAGMENNRGRLAVIAAGYREEMERFINSNLGLRSRFKTFIHFEDYGPAELYEILRGMAAAEGVRLSSDAAIAASWLMESLPAGSKGFGNGRTVRNVYEECMIRMAARLDAHPGIDITVFEKSDIPKPGEMDFF